VIGAAIEVHRHKGPGLLEEIYEKCLMREFEIRGMPAVNQVLVPLEYKGVTFDQPLRLDAIVDRCLIVEIKAVECVLGSRKQPARKVNRLDKIAGDRNVVCRC